jgi:hypothetical protein
MVTKLKSTFPLMTLALYVSTIIVCTSKNSKKKYSIATTVNNENAHILIDVTA